MHYAHAAHRQVKTFEANVTMTQVICALTTYVYLETLYQVYSYSSPVVSRWWTDTLGFDGDKGRVGHASQ